MTSSYAPVSAADTGEKKNENIADAGDSAIGNKTGNKGGAASARKTKVIVLISLSVVVALILTITLSILYGQSDNRNKDEKAESLEYDYNTLLETTYITYTFIQYPIQRMKQQ